MPAYSLLKRLEADLVLIKASVTRFPPMISKHYATIVTNLAVHIRVGLSRRFSELAVFDARLYIQVGRID